MLRGANYKRWYWAVAPQGGAPTRSPHLAGQDARDGYRQFRVPERLQHRFTTFGMNNEFLAGIEYLYEDGRALGPARPARADPADVPVR